jgi:hypothetical protein
MQMNASSSHPTTSSNGRGVEIGGYPMPDTDQMLPFKPTPPHIVTSHPVPGGNLNIHGCLNDYF